MMDHFGIDQAVLMGWSMGVNTMFELAVRHPERVRGLFAVAGVPGDTFATMLGPLYVPRAPGPDASRSASPRVLKYAGKALTPVSTRLPVGPRAIKVISHSGFMFPVADPELAARAVKEFLTTPVDWYFHLALSTSKHARVPLSKVHVPALFVAGAYDILAGARDMATAASALQQGEYVELRGTHFIRWSSPSGSTSCCSTSSSGSADAPGSRGPGLRCGPADRLRPGRQRRAPSRPPAPRRRAPTTAAPSRRRHRATTDSPATAAGRGDHRHRARGAVGAGLPARRRRDRHRARHQAGAADRRRGRRTRSTELGTIEARRRQGEAGLLGVAVSPDFDERPDGCTSTSAPATTTGCCAAQIDGGTLGTPEPILDRHPARRTSTTAGGWRSGPTATSTSPPARPATAELAQDRDSLAGQDPADHHRRRARAGQSRSGHRRSGPGATATSRAWPSTTATGCGPRSSARTRFDELNLIEKGANYGWPEVEGEGGEPDFVDPQVTWSTDEASPSGSGVRSTATSGWPRCRASGCGGST